MTETQQNIQSEPKRVGIIGCGWLGKALAKSLISKNYYVVATTQSPEKITVINALGAQGELLSLPFSADEADNAAVFYCETIVVCIPPQLRRGKTDYAEKIAQIVHQADKGHVKKIIMISTTAIYDGVFGMATEETALNRDIAKVDILAQAEQYVLDSGHISIVLRTGGLVGADRHPGKFFKAGRSVKSPNAYVNLIHQADIVELIDELIASKGHNGIYNAVSDMEVTKKHYYSIAANALSLPEPVFEEHAEAELGKQVIGDKLRYSLTYQFQYVDLVSWLLHPN